MPWGSLPGRFCSNARPELFLAQASGSGERGSERADLPLWPHPNWERISVPEARHVHPHDGQLTLARPGKTMAQSPERP